MRKRKDSLRFRLKNEVCKMKREWVSYDPRENKLECPLRSNGGTRIFVRHSHKENGDEHV